MKKKAISALAITALAGGLSVSKAAVVTSRVERKETAARLTNETPLLNSSQSLAGASGDRPGDHAADVMKKKSSSKKKSSKAS
ncbi:MAG: hypothetical protein K1X78_17425 [Verrucomicrobiaceae bacterium]|nr:hypothetical protein [Verrucomicrobiaceae bacterium]